MAKFWPLSSDYADAVQWPDVSCADPELKAAKVATLANGLPRPPCAGNFADVYQFRSQDGQKLWAVKCFTRRIAGLTERYREISRQLEAARLPFTVAFKYLEQGMLIRGEWFPVLKMDWVEGLTLRQFVEQNLQKPRMLNVLFQIWLKVEPLLRQVGVAHGDLQYGNVMLVPGSSEGKLALRLIDYDGMWVRALAGQPPGEVGHPSFQHPQRAKQNVYSPEIDRFPLLVIACALRCLARPGGERLWKDYDTGDNLLFTKPDFEAPTNSKLLFELWNSGDRELQSWVGHLVTASQAPLEAVPLLSTLVNDGRIQPLSDAEEKSIRSILGSATPVARTDLKSGAETDWWDAEVAASLAEDADDEQIEEIDDEQIEEIEPGSVVRPSKQVGNRIQSGGRRTKQKAEVESDAEPMVPHWVWAAVGTLAVGILIGLFFGTRTPEAVTESGASTATVESSSSTSGTKPTEDSKPETDPAWDSADVHELSTLSGHTREVASVAFSPDGKRLASASWDRTVKVWDATSGAESLTLKGHTGPVRSVAFSPDGKRLASASEDWTVKVWDATSGAESLTLKGHTRKVYRVTFSPDGKRLASASQDQTVKVWDASSGAVSLTLKGHTNEVWSVAFSPDGKRLASASWDRTVKVWDAKSGAESLTLKGHNGVVMSVAFSSDGKRLASVSRDQTVKVWDATSGAESLTLKGHTDWLVSVAFNSDGKRLASAGFDQTVKVWDATSGAESLTLKGHTSAVTSVAFSPDGKRLASASEDGTVKIWGPDQTKVQPSKPPAEPKLTESPKPAPDPGWDPAQVRELGVLTGQLGAVVSMSFSRDGQRLASSSGGNTIKLWHWRSGAELRTLTGHTSAADSVVFSPDGQWLASASRDKTIKLWDASSGEELRTLNGHTSAVMSVCFSPDGQQLASASDDKTIKLWNTSSGTELRTLTGHNGQIWCVSFSPDGQRLASASDDQTVKVWDARSRAELRTLTGHTSPVTSVSFSPDGERLASASEDHTIKLWDARSGVELRTLSGHTSAVTNVSFSPDGQRLVSASWDHTIKLWDAGSGAVLRTLTGHTQAVWSVSFSPDGQQLASGSLDNTIRLWGTGPVLKLTTPALPVATSAAPTPVLLTSDANEFTNTLGMKFVRIEPGLFRYQDLQNIRLSKPFLMAVHEVTETQFASVMSQSPPVKNEDLPANAITWADAVNFCKRLSDQTGLRYRLPTEAEWEYCCRAGTKTEFSFGDDRRRLNEFAWPPGASEKRHPVGKKLANPWGLFDMHGNVAEWTQDKLSPTTNRDTVTDPVGEISGNFKPARGGSFRSLNVAELSSKGRQLIAVGSPDERHGFRVLLEFP